MPSYKTSIVMSLQNMFKGVISAEKECKHNTGRYLFAAYFWDAVEAHAKKESAKAWDAIKLNGVAKLEGLEQGEYTLAESPHLAITAKVTAPVKRFDADQLSNLLFAAKKVPHHVTKELIEQAKVPGKARVTVSVSEKEDV